MSDAIEVLIAVYGARAVIAEERVNLGRQISDSMLQLEKTGLPLLLRFP